MNIFLIGYRGSGKTTLGKLLAKKLNMKFVDTDDLIVKEEKRSIPDIFRQNGEKYFREVETKVLEKVVKKNNQVVSTGGGIILSEYNRNLIKQNGICIYLKITPEICYERIYNDNNRPALTQLSPMDEIVHIMGIREKYYQETSQYVVDTGTLNIQESLEEILNFLGKFL